ncbi:hypothetical protein FRC00_009078 [Tulasnella sp. 408]|nr:hypothetical protein FRC00_009078 [Tulasnella sp. 408]
MSVLLDSRPQEQDIYDPLAGEEAFEMDDDPLAGEDEEDPLGGSGGGEHEDGIGKRDSPVDSYANKSASATTPLDEDETMASSIHDGQDEEDPLGGGDDRPADDEEFDPFGDYESEKRPPRSEASSMLEDTEPTMGMAGDEDEEDPFGAPTRDAGRTATGPSPLERLAGRLSHEDDDTMVDSRTDFDSLFPYLPTGTSSSSNHTSSAGPPIVARSFGGRSVAFSRRVKRDPEAKSASSSVSLLLPSWNT